MPRLSAALEDLCDCYYNKSADREMISYEKLSNVAVRAAVVEAITRAGEAVGI